jgi:CRP-like cAMP-binding protein
MLRAGQAAPGLGLGRAALVADIDRLSLRLPALGSLSSRERRELAARARVYDVPPGTAIVRQGERSTMAYFLLDGRTVASRAGAGVERILDVHNPGDFFGEIAALTNLPRTASVLAEQPTTLLQVPAAVLQTLMRDPQLKRLFLGKMTERMQRMNMIEPPRFAGLTQA